MASKLNGRRKSVRYLKFQQYRYFMKRTASEVHESPMDTFMRELMTSETAQANISAIVETIERSYAKRHMAQINKKLPDVLERAEHNVNACYWDPNNRKD